MRLRPTFVPCPALCSLNPSSGSFYPTSLQAPAFGAMQGSPLPPLSPTDPLQTKDRVSGVHSIMVGIEGAAQQWNLKRNGVSLLHTAGSVTTNPNSGQHSV